MTITTDEVETRLRAALGATIPHLLSDETAQPSRTTDPVATTEEPVLIPLAPSDMTASRHGAIRWRLLGAAAAVVMLVGGLAIAQLPQTDPAPAEQPLSPPAPATDEPAATVPPAIASARPLVSLEHFVSSDWVVAFTPPPGTELVLARRDVAGPDEIRTVSYGPASGDDQSLTLIIEIDPPPSPATGQTITIAGTEWSINIAESDGWNVSRRVGDHHIEVQGPGQIDVDMLASLLVVDETDLPLAPLGLQADARVVARTQFEDQTYSYAVQESGRYRCGWITSTGDGGGHRCRAVPSDALVTDGTQSIPAQPGRVVAVAWGTAAQDIATVEIELADGTIITAEPTDLSDTFDSRFWIAAASTTTPTSDPAVAVVRAYDSGGLLIATEVPTAAG